jgi:hypothetical protein
LQTGFVTAEKKGIGTSEVQALFELH